VPNIVRAYIDTTVKSFDKPELIKVQAYKYETSKIDNFIDLAADKVGGSFIGNIVGGPTGLIFKVSDRAFEIQESKEKK
jgi:hypothetical protein